MKQRPRGSKTGTQGLENAYLRSVIPAELFVDIFEEIIEDEREWKTKDKIQGR